MKASASYASHDRLLCVHPQAAHQTYEHMLMGTGLKSQKCKRDVAHLSTFSCQNLTRCGRCHAQVSIVVFASSYTLQSSQLLCELLSCATVRARRLPCMLRTWREPGSARLPEQSVDPAIVQKVDSKAMRVTKVVTSPCVRWFIQHARRVSVRFPHVLRRGPDDCITRNFCSFCERPSEDLAEWQISRCTALSLRSFRIYLLVLAMAS
jgi:hypothetical protein